MRKILILFAHPAFEKSRVNKCLIDGIEEIGGVTFRDLYEIYPEIDIDPDAERKLIEQHDVVLLQYPFFLFGMPALIKEWMDLVLVHGWAFGSRGTALKGKWFGSVMTTGGSRGAYQPGGFNRFTIRQLICPLEQVACLCRMHFLPPWVVHGTNAISREEILRQKERYHAMLARLADDATDLHRYGRLEYLNHYQTAGE
ncbi:NAD(P)H-dependent oxidoreductase [Prosthecochloris sp. N3]|uniref:NAD(P)H-dependent oxidoreductase n=1 Tax=Prosthecochloris ethylica TaxID=2743976 RepID=A0ABR9XSM4_9CHLB|nr:NAD(P)H-dependent oxidoreductase [Prosthecochloris ethylica]MBF0637050.1 NAD(P)H-dependent oxidoreductase [Prosthecochloris ethylica]NUK47287.1 NAD(P)H-dependent oxidoreductase [Prosthecochloris ethylica]